MNKWYRKNLKKFINYVGEPSRAPLRNYILLIMGLVYIFLGVLLMFIKDDSIVANLWARMLGIKAMFMFVLIIGGYFMLVVGLFRLNMMCWKIKHKVVNERKCWLILKILFVGIIPFLYIKCMISYILHESRQINVVDYISEIIMAFYLSFFILVSISFGLINKLTKYWENGIEIMMFLSVVGFIGVFGILSKKFIHSSIKRDVRHSKERELKRKSKENIKETLKSKLIVDEMKRRCEERYKIVDNQLNYSNLYFYVVVNLILLCVHVEDTTGYWDIFVNQFMGITTLTALLREVKAQKQTEECYCERCKKEEK